MAQLRWPAVSYEDWSATCDTLHAHTQVLGKLAATLAPPEPQLLHAALRLTARGWETVPLPAPDGSGAVEIDPTPQEVSWSEPLDEDAALSPAAARWDSELGLYVLDWDDVRSEADPHACALDFARSTFRHACLVCGWDEELAASAEGAPPPVT
jgi:Family of unknown function (DUF5996)